MGDNFLELVVRLLEASLQSAQVALRMIITINGGAAVALLALLGSLASSENASSYLESFASNLSHFACGVVYGTVGLVTAYMSNFSNYKVHSYLYSESKADERNAKVLEKRRYRWFYFGAAISLITLLFALLGIRAFLSGVDAFSSSVSKFEKRAPTNYEHIDPRWV